MSGRRMRLGIVSLALALVAGCGDAAQSSGPDMGAPACSVVPQASNDIINACTVDTRETVDLVPEFPSAFPPGTPPALVQPH